LVQAPIAPNCPSASQGALVNTIKTPKPVTKSTEQPDALSKKRVHNESLGVIFSTFFLFFVLGFELRGLVGSHSTLKLFYRYDLTFLLGAVLRLLFFFLLPQAWLRL
jgi:hypothetical protein